MKRIFGFLQYLLKQDEKCMVFQVLRVTIEDTKKTVRRSGERRYTLTLRGSKKTTRP